MLTIACCCLQPLQIKSAVAVEGLKGYIYIEAYKQTHVKQVNNNDDDDGDDDDDDDHNLEDGNN